MRDERVKGLDTALCLILCCVIAASAGCTSERAETEDKQLPQTRRPDIVAALCGSRLHRGEVRALRLDVRRSKRQLVAPRLAPEGNSPRLLDLLG